MKTITYNFYKEIDGLKVFKELLGDKYIIEFYEDGKIVSLHFYFDYNGDLIIDNVYKNMRNYKTYRYIKKYAKNKKLVNTMMQLFEKSEFAFHMRNKETGEERIKKVIAYDVTKAHCKDVGYGKEWTWTGTEPWSNVSNRVQHIGNGYYKLKK